MMNIQEITNRFMQNPLAMLSQRFSIPGNLNDPNQIIQHLLNTGQVTQQQVNNAMQMRSMFNNTFK